MQIESSRFGTINVAKEELLIFPDGILGFEEEKSFCIIDSNDNTYLLWLQSTNNPNVCFPMLEPIFYIQNFQANLLPSDLRSLNIDSENEVCFYTIVTIPSNIQEISANLKAPIAINYKSKLSRQIVLQDNKLEVNHPIYTEFKRTLSQIKQYKKIENKKPAFLEHRDLAHRI